MTTTPAFAPTALVGRDAVLDTVDTLVGGLDHGSSDLVVVTGPVGVGRSAVLDWAVTRARAAGLTVGVARCNPCESRIPHAAVTQLMSSLGSPAWISSFAAGLDRGTHLTTAVAGMCDALLAESSDRPVLLAVDDVHLADPDSLRWLVELGRRIHHGSILALVTSPVPIRQVLAPTGVLDRAQPCPAQTTLRLEPLPPDEAHRLLEQRAGRPLPPSVRAVSALADGAPAVLCAVADHIATLDRPLTTDAIPPLIATARAAWSQHALATTQGLSDNAVCLLRALAAVGTVLDPAGIATVTGLSATDHAEALDTLRGCGLLADSDPPRLRHASFADDVLAGMTRTARDVLQLKAAALRSGHRVRIGTIADMLGAVIGLVRPWAAAAEANPAVRRDGTAADLTTTALRHALREPMTVAERAGLLTRLATIEAVTTPQASDGRLRQVMLRYARPETWPAVLHAADLLLCRGDAESTRLTIADVHQGALATIPDAQLDALRALARLAEDEKSGPPLVAPPPAGTEHPGHPAQAAVLAWTAAVRADHRDHALTLARAALERPAAIPLMCRIAAARALLCADDISGGRAALAAVITDAGRVDARAAAARALLSRAEVTVRQGRPGDALGDLVAAAATLPPASWHPLLLPRLTGARILALIRCGRLDEARRAAADTEYHGVSSAFLLYAQAELALVHGDAAHALLLLEESGRLLESKGWRNPLLVPWRGTAAVAHHLLGASVTATALIAEEDRIAEAWGTPATCAAVRARTHDTFARYGVGLPAVPAPRTAEPMGTGSGEQALTAAERDLADLVLAGLANRDIAARLGLSTRTIELRLTGIYRKLAIKGRAALAARLRAAHEVG
ncbi:AAA family ATPase [Streptomyces sp. NPDC002513]